MLGLTKHFSPQRRGGAGAKRILNTYIEEQVLRLELNFNQRLKIKNQAQISY